MPGGYWGLDGKNKLWIKPGKTEWLGGGVPLILELDIFHLRLLWEGCTSLNSHLLLEDKSNYSQEVLCITPFGVPVVPFSRPRGPAHGCLHFSHLLLDY